jgi:hypothetical protein
MSICLAERKRERKRERKKVAVEQIKMVISTRSLSSGGGCTDTAFKKEGERERERKS